MRCAQGRPSHVLSSSEAIDRASAAPPDPSPCLEREGTRQGLRHAVFGAIRGPVPGRGCGDPARRRRLPVQRTYDVSRSGLPSASSRAPSAAESSRIPETRVDGDGPGPGLVLGYHTAAGAEEVELLLPLRHHGHLQPLHRGMDGGGSGELGLGRAPDPAELPEAWRPAPGPDLALRSRSSDDEPMHGSAPRRSRRDPLAEPTPGLG